ncbi:hypothetical protein VIGAN_08268300 [Vigna angularis var. angularis]|uniref:Uncharacterized protein n=1 Tax=Vigna angularis var. angularis TaxID=157739 RepID=A0A0S3SSV2_PHAAN|nr:hypothetical protein VIGAN_08268300 [Vigna angularis var. angularis]
MRIEEKVDPESVTVFTSSSSNTQAIGWSVQQPSRSRNSHPAAAGGVQRRSLQAAAVRGRFIPFRKLGNSSSGKKKKRSSIQHDPAERSTREQQEMAYLEEALISFSIKRCTWR